MRFRLSAFGFRLSALLIAAALPAAAEKKKEAAAPGWPGTEMPLPLAVRTPQDLAFKALAEKQYLLFNLLAGGKLAFDKGDFATAAQKWETLLQIEGLDPALDHAVRRDARERHVGVRRTETQSRPDGLLGDRGQRRDRGTGEPGHVLGALERQVGRTLCPQ